MYIDGVGDRIAEIKEKIGISENELEYPTLPKNIINNEPDS